MVRPALRSRSIRRKNIVTPGGKRRILYSRKRYGLAKCRVCGKQLGGVARSLARGLPRSKRTLARPFGASVCHGCLRQALKEAARGP